MKKRKLIGVIISEVEELYQQKLLKGIISECYALDYDVAVFSTLIKTSNMPEYNIGEMNIFNLMNFDHFDGIIVAGLTLVIEHLPEEIEKLLLQKCKCPVLYVDYSSKHFPYIYTNDRKASEQITDHLIDFHGYKDIFCLAADPNSVSTISRVTGFKDSLRKHGMPILEDRISYDGDFYYPGGERLASKIINGEIDRPEAVVCISDYMAIGLINELNRNGIRVPEDIAVTGYDATDEAALCKTVITTYSPPIVQTGVDAVVELTGLMTGTIPKPITTTSSHLDIGHSCGCNDAEYVKRSTMLRLKEKTEDYKMLLDSYMSEALTSIFDLYECTNNICYYLYVVKDYSDYYLCLCDNWDGSDDSYSEGRDRKLTTGYTDQMRMVLAAENRGFASNNTSFDTRDMIPDLWKDREKPKTYYFTPIHFNENTMGYSVLTYGDKVKSFDISYRNWSRNVMNALEFNRAHRRLYQSSFRDVLTGIYNRNGLEQNLSNILSEVIGKNKKLLVIMSDLDNLKMVNDEYGHKEGDNVITVVANAFQSNCSGSDICARIGGDEFLILSAVDEDQNSGDTFIASVSHYIEQYNQKSLKPYKIEISMGAFCDYVEGPLGIEDLIDLADHAMYQNKAENKKRRS